MLNFRIPILTLGDSMKYSPCKRLVQYLNVFNINPNTQSDEQRIKIRFPGTEKIQILFRLWREKAEKHGSSKPLVEKFPLCLRGEQPLGDELTLLWEDITMHFSRISLQRDINIYHPRRDFWEMPWALNRLPPFMLHEFLLLPSLLSPESLFPTQLKEHGSATLTKIFHYL